MELFWRIFDTLLLVAGLTYIFIKYVRPFFAKRRQEIIDSFNQAKEAEKRTKELYDETEKKLREAKLEFEKLKEETEKEAAFEKERMIKEAQMSAKNIAERYVSLAQAELNRQKEELYLEVLNMSIKIAEDILKREITPETKEQMNKSLIKKMGELVGK